MKPRTGKTMWRARKEKEKPRSPAAWVPRHSPGPWGVSESSGDLPPPPPADPDDTKWSRDGLSHQAVTRLWICEQSNVLGH